MKISEENKPGVLLALLGERYAASHHMRDRSMQFVLWILGLGIGLMWVILKGEPLSGAQSIILGLAVMTFGALSIYFVRAIHRGFKANHRTMLDIEDALGCYDDGVYLESSSLYPKKYKGGPRFTTSHFVACYVWITAVALFIVLLLAFTPGKNVGPTKPSPAPVQESTR